VSAFELPVIKAGPKDAATASAPPARSAAWLRAAGQAKLLAWASLAWMSVEGVVGVLAGVQAHSLGVVTWAASSFVEALASLIVVWRFTGHRTLSATSEARAEKWVAASFFLLAPYFVVEAVRKLIDGGRTDTTVLAVALTVSAIVLMPLLGWAKLRLGRTLDSGGPGRDRARRSRRCGSRPRVPGPGRGPGHRRDRPEGGPRWLARAGHVLHADARA